MTSKIIFLVFFVAGLIVGWLLICLLSKWKTRRNRRKSLWRRLKD
jgi:uncharacterized membrane protein YciS (DUF1049 family)